MSQLIGSKASPYQTELDEKSRYIISIGVLNSVQLKPPNVSITPVMQYRNIKIEVLGASLLH